MSTNTHFCILEILEGKGGRIEAFSQRKDAKE